MKAAPRHIPAGSYHFIHRAAFRIVSRKLFGDVNLFHKTISEKFFCFFSVLVPVCVAVKWTASVGERLIELCTWSDPKVKWIPTYEE